MGNGELSAAAPALSERQGIGWRETATIPHRGDIFHAAGFLMAPSSLSRTRDGLRIVAHPHTPLCDIVSVVSRKIDAVTGGARTQLRMRFAIDRNNEDIYTSFHSSIYPLYKLSPFRKLECSFTIQPLCCGPAA